MKVLHVAASDRSGGAAIGAYRLHKALQKKGIESEMLVLRKVTRDPSVHRLSSYFSRWQRAQRRLAEQRHHRRLADNPRQADAGHWSLNLFSYPIAKVINSFAADIVHLQWVGDNYLPIEALTKIEAPIVWTVRDMWAFTGGCHYAGECMRYNVSCGNCPKLIEGSTHDITSIVNRRKQATWAELPLTIVCLSRWLADCARNSAVMRDRRIEVIGNPIDPSIFKPIEQSAGRQAYNLPADKKLILFGAIGGASDRRKGFHYLQEALRALGEQSELELVVFGSERRADVQLQMPVYQVGQFQDAVSLSLLYSACDVYVLPTMQEAFGNTLLESLASGTPCVTFDGSGAVDIVQHRQNGYAAWLRDSSDLLRGIEWTLAQSWSSEKLHEDIIARYGEQTVAQQYIELYESLIGQAT